MQTTWDLQKYFYTGLDDTKLADDIKKAIPTVQAFADTFTGKIVQITTAEELLAYYEASEKLDQQLQ